MSPDPEGRARVYDPKKVEDKWYRFWEERKLFASRPDSARKKYSIALPPPNVTGELHMGHALNDTIQDILIRLKRQQGYDALWQPGCDHAGIATQNVVERKLREEEGKSRFDYGRAGLVAKIWEWKEEYQNRIVNQIKRLGCSCDWDRERFTMDEGLSRAVRRVFVELYRKGLIYRDFYIVNWCPRCGTAISDDETEHKPLEGGLWNIKYPFADDPKKFVSVSTTRPETMLGDTAVAVHPDDERYKDIVGKNLLLPLVDREIPIVADDWVKPDFGTGAVKVTPAHDPNDFAIGKRHDLAQVNILTEDAHVNENGGPYKGMNVDEARAAVVEDLKKQGLLESYKPYPHEVPHCYRCKSIIEPYLSRQWFVKMAPLVGPAIEEVKEGRVKFFPGRWENTYFDWLENVRDWCISRQIWWGHRIPVWYCRDCSETIVAEETPRTCPECGSKNLDQETDVLDTWFSSALWPFSTLGWPDETAHLGKYYPTDVLATAREIIYFWVARMVIMGMKFLGRRPFDCVYIHATILDEFGKVMSKSAGNGIDPIEMIDAYGADAVRFSLTNLTTEGQDIRLSPTKFEMGRNFTNKIWNAARFVMMNIEGAEGLGTLDVPRRIEDRWVLSKLAGLIEPYTGKLSSFRFNEAVMMIYDFFWHTFCDWYVEIVKDRMKDDNDPADRACAQKILYYTLKETLALLHPIIPFITEDLRHDLTAMEPGQAADPDRSIMVDSWPDVSEKFIDTEVEERMDLLLSTVRAVRNVRKVHGIADRAPVSAAIRSAAAEDRAAFEAEGEFLRRVAHIDSLAVGESIERPAQSAVQIIGTNEIFIPLADLIDTDAVVSKLKKEYENREKALRAVEAKLANENFIAKAKPEVVERERARRDEIIAQIDKIKENMEQLA